MMYNPLKGKREPEAPFQYLYLCLAKAGLLNNLEFEGGPFTLFAPTDGAMKLHLSTVGRVFLVPT